jgi:serine phosphatase RsbU (regulator of sigma subunit)
VVGHSLEAASIMAQLRTGIRSYMTEGHPPTQTIQLLNNLLQRFHPAITATACCAIFDRRTGDCELANAGHPYPLIVKGEQSLFLPGGGTLLGFTGYPVQARLFRLEPGDTLLLYTDGLIERRDESIDEGFARLARVATPADHSLEEFCDRVLREAGPPEVTDDIAMVAFRRMAIT